MTVNTKTWYQSSFETHWSAVLGILRYLITQFADESVEVAARAVALAAPLPNAINMYNVGINQLGWSQAASFAFSLTLEIVVFLLVEIALLMWDGYLIDKVRFKMPLAVSVVIVLISVAVVMTIVYQLEAHKIMALLPVISLCSFVGIGLKRWNERHTQNDAETPIVPVVEPETLPAEDRIDETVERRKRLAEYCKINGFRSLQTAADELAYTSKTVARNDLMWLEKQGIVHVDRSGKSMAVTVNGRYDSFMED